MLPFIMERKLASIQTIKALNPDRRRRIGSSGPLSWGGTRSSKKGEFEVRRQVRLLRDRLGAAF